MGVKYVFIVSGIKMIWKRMSPYMKGLPWNSCWGLIGEKGGGDEEKIVGQEKGCWAPLTSIFSDLGTHTSFSSLVFLWMNWLWRAKDAEINVLLARDRNCRN